MSAPAHTGSRKPFFGLSKQDWTLGAIDRMAVRYGANKEQVENLLHTRAGLAKEAAKKVADFWFDQGFRHGGILFRRNEYLARSALSKEPS